MEATNLPSVSTNFYVGLGLAISSGIFIGASFVIKKKGLLRLSRRGLRAASGGYGYLKDYVWWMGLLSMGIGELANFIAYAFAPASLVTPLGVISVLVGAILSSKYLGERLNLLGKIGCLLCVFGSTVTVIHSPKEGLIDSMDELRELTFQTGFMCYVSAVIVVSISLVLFFVPKYGATNVVIYILICSLIGSLSVMECKGIGLAIRQTINGTKNEFLNSVTWLFLIGLIICVSVQLNYLNKALDTFNTSIVTPVYYVFFTTFVICASSILFEEWKNMSFADIIGGTMGFFTVVCGIFLLNAFKEWDISLNNLSTVFPKKEYTDSGQINESNTASVFPDCHCHGKSETSCLLERHSRQNSRDSRLLIEN